MKRKPIDLFTPGGIAEQLQVRSTRVNYVLRTRSEQIRPFALAGRMRLYDAEAIDKVRKAIDLLDAERRLGIR